MANLVEWLLTTAFYSLIACTIRYNSKAKSSNLFPTISIVALLCAPFNINGDIWTVFGNARSEKNIYSVASMIQDAEQNAYAIVAGGQFSAKGNVYALIAMGQQTKVGNAAALLTIFQFPGNDANAGFVAVQKAGANTSAFFCVAQKAGIDAHAILGLSAIQIAMRDAMLVIGISAYQQAGNNAGLGMGISAYQKAGNAAYAFLGLTGYQRAGNLTAADLNLVGYQQADRTIALVAGCQRAKKRAEGLLALYQSIPSQSRYFGLCSVLGTEKTPPKK